MIAYQMASRPGYPRSEASQKVQWLEQALSVAVTKQAVASAPPGHHHRETNARSTVARSLEKISFSRAAFLLSYVLLIIRELMN